MTGTATLYVHIGAHKTGTSAIQDYCYDNAEVLRAQGVVYPREPTYIKGHHPVTWALGVPHPRAGHDVDPDELFDGLFSEADEAGITSLILSSEGFEYLERPERLRRAAKDRRVVVVCYLRSQTGYLQSMYNHHLRIPAWRYRGTIEEFYREHDLGERLDYLLWISRWADTFGRTAIRLRDYDAVARSDGVVRDFAAVVGIDTEGTTDTDRVVNPSLGPLESEALRWFNTADLSQAAHLDVVAFLRWAAGRGLLEERFGSPGPPVPDTLRREISSAYRDRNLELVELFPELGRGFAAQPEPPRTAGGVTLPSGTDMVAELAPAFFEWIAEESQPRASDRSQ